MYLNRTFRFVLVIGIISFSLLCIFYLFKIAYPFIIGLAIAFIINPLVNFFHQKCRLPRGLSVILALLIIFSLFAGLLTLLIAEIVSGAEHLAKVVPHQLQTLITYLEHFFASQIIPLYNQLSSIVNDLGSNGQETIVKNIQNIGSTIGTTIGSFIERFFEFIPTIISWFPNAASVLVFSLLATFFISKDWYRLSRLGANFVPKQMKKSSQTVIVDLKKALFGFLKAQLTLISITTVIILVGLLILRVDYAITIALVTGLVDILPYLGTGLVFVPWIIYEMITGSMNAAIGLGVLYIIVLVQRQIMEPKVLSSSIGMDPLATLISLFVGFKLIGFLGLIIGPVTLVILTTLHKANVFKDVWTFIKGDEEIKS
jgi:sporulation integral membrane protein YtvI